MFNYTLRIDHNLWTSRDNHRQGEGGALNAGYTPVDALCAISNHLGKHGLIYNTDWHWDGFGSKFEDDIMMYTINLCFNKQEHTILVQMLDNCIERLKV